MSRARLEMEVKKKNNPTTTMTMRVRVMRTHQTAVGQDFLLLKQLGRMRSPHSDGAEPQLCVDDLMNFMESKPQGLELFFFVVFFNLALLKPGAVNRQAHTAITAAALFHDPPPPSIVYALIQFSALWFSQQTDSRRAMAADRRSVMTVEERSACSYCTSVSATGLAKRMAAEHCS